MHNLLKLFTSRPDADAETAAAPSPALTGSGEHAVPATPAGEPAQAAPSPVAAADAVTPVLDTLGTMLQCWSRHPIVLPGEERVDAERTVMEWQRHATLGAPIPGVHAPDAVAGPVHARDWSALASLSGARRRAEATVVGEQLGDLRKVVWDTVASLARVAGDDVASDRAVSEQLEALRTSAQRGDAAAVMRELPAALTVISDALTARQARAARERVMMAERVESLGRALSDAEDGARTDPLTGAGNRLRFTEACDRALALMLLAGTPSSLLAIDMDGLKVINDTFGHAAGDLAIQWVSKACWSVCTRATDVVCRIGGDEFAVVMPNTNVTAAATLADRLEQRLQERPVQLADGVKRIVTASIGFATAQPGEGAEAWIARADARLYDVKKTRAA